MPEGANWAAVCQPLCRAPRVQCGPCRVCRGVCVRVGARGAEGRRNSRATVDRSNNPTDADPKCPDARGGRVHRRPLWALGRIEPSACCPRRASPGAHTCAGAPARRAVAHPKRPPRSHSPAGGAPGRAALRCVAGGRHPLMRLPPRGVWRVRGARGARRTERLGVPLHRHLRRVCERVGDGLGGEARGVGGGSGGGQREGGGG